MLIGVVGKANVGKSTFFKAATLAEVEIANYPFATIKPNHGCGFVRVACIDHEFNVQCNPRFGYCINHMRFVPVDLIDVAGLVPGAHKGLGMGNQFLDDLRQADALIHVIDVAGTTNEKGEPIAVGNYDPTNDIRFLEEELDYWYLGVLKRGWERFARQMIQERQEIQKALAKQLSGLKVTEEIVEQVITELALDPERPNSWSEDQLLKLAHELRKKTKPMIIVCNKIDVPGAQEHFERLQKTFPAYTLIPCSAEAELALREAARHHLISYVPGDKTFQITSTQMNEKQQQALSFIQRTILDIHQTTGVQQALDTAVFTLLRMIAIFPGGVNNLMDKDGNVLPDCFLMPPGTTALDFAFKIHQDLGKNFIKAIDVRKKLPVGKDHPLQHRDIIEIKTGR
ncbi:redox-regulated ATPase YchF [Candidatus Woesearchaeota archaeon]|nr:redox-regulated ATPase YchF [Candidatus Woesearchaeota archaeon]